MKRRKGRILHKLKPITIRQIIEMVAQEALTKTSGSYNYNQLEAEILGNGFQASRVSSTESSVKLQIGGWSLRPFFSSYIHLYTYNILGI